MLLYFVKRFLLIIPAILGVILVSFFINSNSGADILSRVYDLSQNKSGTDAATLITQKKNIKHQTGLDLPVFYFTLKSLAQPDTLSRIAENSEQKMLNAMICENGNWPAISAYYLTLKNLESALTSAQNDSLSALKSELLLITKNLLSETNSVLRNQSVENLQKYHVSEALDVELKDNIKETYDAFLLLNKQSCIWKNYIPTLSFNFLNQFHIWLFGDTRNEIQEAYRQKGLLHGDLGISYRTKQPVWQLLLPKLKWSFFLAIISILLSYLISIPLGLMMAKKHNTLCDKFLSNTFYLLYAIPGFWMGLLLLMLLANQDVFAIFPASGVMPPQGYPENSGFFTKLFITLPYLVLPVICYAYSFTAFLARLTKVSVLETLPMDYIRTARAKGVNENRIIFSHAFRNALLPLITVFVNVFPIAIGGSVIIETMFSIPGLGYEIYTAAIAKDFPVITAIFMITAFFTMAAYLAGDMIYTLADPRINYKNK